MAYGEIIYAQFFGLSLLMWLGIIALILFIITAVIGALAPKGLIKVGLGWHMKIAKLALLIAIIHGALAFVARI